MSSKKWNDPQLDAAQFAIDRFSIAQQAVSEQMAEIYQSTRDGCATDPTRVHTGIVGRTSTNERWQAEDCGRQMTDKHPKRPRDNKTPPHKKTRSNSVGS